jgi:hypothetical protein
MLTNSADTVLKPGDVFELNRTPNTSVNQASTYLVHRFRDGAMHVSELDGQERNGLSVAARDIPSPYMINNWFNTYYNMGDAYPDTVAGVAHALRKSLDDLRFANNIPGARTTFLGPVDENDPYSASFSIEQNLMHGQNAISDPRGLFSVAGYELGRMGVKPDLGRFDVERLGLVPDGIVTGRLPSGRPEGYSSRYFDLVLDDDGIASIQAVADSVGLQIWGPYSKGSRIFARGYIYDGSVETNLHAFLPGEGRNPKRFDTLEAAYNAVKETHSRTFKALET